MADSEESLCPTGADCFYTISVYLDGRITLDDYEGRIEQELSDSDLEEFEALMNLPEFETATRSPGDSGCALLEGDVEVKIGLSVGRRDGGETVFSATDGCIAAEYTADEDHALRKLRVLFNDNFRWGYAGCTRVDQLEGQASSEGMGTRPLCQTEFQSIAVGSDYGQIQTTTTRDIDAGF